METTLEEQLRHRRAEYAYLTQQRKDVKKAIKKLIKLIAAEAAGEFI
jgi:chromosome segregation ATPase